MPGPYVYATLHRREFTSSFERMQLVFSALSAIASEHCPVVLPLHPRTRDAIERIFKEYVEGNLLCFPKEVRVSINLWPVEGLDDTHLKALRRHVSPDVAVPQGSAATEK